MKRIIIKESQAPYRVAIDDEMLGEEADILERDGQPVAALIPIADYEAFQTWQQTKRGRHHRLPQQEAFERERAAFERMKPDLLRAYPGKVVAIYQGEIVEVGTDLAETRDKVYDRFGYVPCYVQVVEEIPHIYKFPHRKIVY